MRNLGFEVRAGARRSQASSLRMRFCRLASAAAATPVPLDPLQNVGGIATVEGFDDPVVNLPCSGCDFVEKPAVVGDDQQSAGCACPPLLQMPGKPGDALDIQVVGRFVQCYDVPVADQQCGELYAAALTARQ